MYPAFKDRWQVRFPYSSLSLYLVIGNVDVMVGALAAMSYHNDKGLHPRAGASQVHTRVS